MAGITEVNTWENEIYQLETTDRVVGGAAGISNRQAKQLANRTQYLKFKADDPARVVAGLLPLGLEACRVQGAATSKVGTLYAVAAGSIYMNGNIYQVSAHSLNTASDVVWAAINNTLVLQVDNGQGVADFSILYTLKEYLENAAPIGTFRDVDLTQAAYFNGSGAGLGPFIGWQVCNGQNGAPDLGATFIVASDDLVLPVGSTSLTTAADQVSGSGFTRYALRKIRKMS